MPQGNTARVITGQLPRSCSICGRILETHEYECCNRLQLVQVRRRESPPLVEIQRCPADGLLKEYVIAQNGVDGAFNCNCPSFEEQNNEQLQAGAHPEIPFAFCKHILKLPQEILHSGIQKFNAWKEQNGGRIIPPSVAQMAMLAPFGVRVNDRLSTNQAYHIISSALKRQGIFFPEFENVIITRGRISVLPKIVFGVEIENYVPGSIGTEGMARILRDSGINIASERYNHNLRKDWKIVHDSSLSNPPDSYVGQEVVSPPLYGAYGFEQIERVCKALNEQRCQVNRTCGLHVHLNAQLVPRDKLVELMKVWMIIEKRFIWGMVPPSRRELPYRDARGNQHTRGGTYCRAITERDLQRCIQSGPESFNANNDDHRMSLGFGALGRHGSVEIRTAAGTTQYDKIRNWTIMLTKLFDSVWNRGKVQEDFMPLRTIDEFFDMIGMDRETAVSPLITSRNFLTRRFVEEWDWPNSPTFRDDVSRSSTPDQRVRLASEEETVEESEEETVEEDEEAPAATVTQLRGTAGEEGRMARVRRDYSRRVNRAITEYDENQPVNSINNICAKPMTRRLDVDFIERGMLASGRWEVPSQSNPNISHLVTFSRENDTLTCRCRSFNRRRNGRFCSHIQAIARYIYYLRHAGF